MHIALAGGVGGAKLAHGLVHLLDPDDLLIVVNTGDDFTHLGHRICPDLDTVMYTLAGIANPETGWGIKDETWDYMDRIASKGGETWFRIGDRDLKTHEARTALLRDGQSLAQVMRTLATSLGVRHRIAPATNDPVSTVILSRGERIPFQDYFVRMACEPPISGVEFEGADTAEPVPDLVEAFSSEAVESVIICPSNPFVSIGPILAIPGLQSRIQSRDFPVVAVSPIIGGRSVKGPAGKMMEELGIPVSSTTVARCYQEVIDALVVDRRDRSEAAAIERLGQRVLVTDTLMSDDRDRKRLASEVLEFVENLFADGVSPRR